MLPTRNSTQKGTRAPAQQVPLSWERNSWVGGFESRSGISHELHPELSSRSAAHEIRKSARRAAAVRQQRGFGAAHRACRFTHGEAYGTRCSPDCRSMQWAAFATARTLFRGITLSVLERPTRPTRAQVHDGRLYPVNAPHEGRAKLHGGLSACLR